MGSEARRKAIAEGRIVENAAAVRRRRRKEAAILREELAIELWAKGFTSAQISAEMERRYGVKLVGNIPELVRRGLYRRVEANSPNVEVAREMLLTQYRKLLEVYMPRALGEGELDEEGNQPAPDPRAADLVLKVLDKMGVATGAIAPPRSGDIHLNLGVQPPPDAETQRTKILDGLIVERAKQDEIEATLAGTPAIAGPREDVQDGKILPPVPAAPTERN